MPRRSRPWLTTEPSRPRCDTSHPQVSLVLVSASPLLFIEIKAVDYHDSYTRLGILMTRSAVLLQARDRQCVALYAAVASTTAFCLFSCLLGFSWYFFLHSLFLAPASSRLAPLHHLCPRMSFSAPSQRRSPISGERQQTHLFALPAAAIGHSLAFFWRFYFVHNLWLVLLNRVVDGGFG